jgi:hypothetical protein
MSRVEINIHLNTEYSLHCTRSAASSFFTLTVLSLPNLPRAAAFEVMRIVCVEG